MNILNEIITLDKNAAAHAEKAADAERKRSAEVDGAKAKLCSQKVEAEREKTSALRSEQEKILGEKLSGAEKERARRCKELSDIFEENKERWKAEIISRITEG